MSTKPSKSTLSYPNQLEYIKHPVVNMFMKPRFATHKLEVSTTLTTNTLLEMYGPTKFRVTPAVLLAIDYYVYFKPLFSSRYSLLNKTINISH